MSELIEVKVETGVEIPPAPKNMVYGFLYKMQVGESVLLDTATLNRPSFLMCRGYCQKTHGKKFVTRTEGTGLRVWRVQ